MERPKSLDVLSDELHLRWMRALTAQELKQIERVSRRWLKLARDWSLWRPIVLRQIILTPIRKPAELTWYDLHWSRELRQRQFLGLRSGNHCVRVRHKIRGSHKPKVACVNGKLRLVAVDAQGRIVCYSPIYEKSEVVFEAESGQEVVGFEIVRLGLKTHLAVSCSHSGIVVVNLDELNSPQRRLRTAAPVDHLTAFTDGKGDSYLTGSAGSEVLAWRLFAEFKPRQKNAALVRLFEDKVTALHVLPRSGCIAVASDSRVHLWDLNRPEAVITLVSKCRIVQLQSVVLRGKRYLLGGDGEHIQLWDLSQHRSVEVFQSGAPWLATEGGRSGRLFHRSSSHSLALWKLRPTQLVGERWTGQSAMTCIAKLQIGAASFVLTGFDGAQVEAENALTGRLTAVFRASGPVKALVPMTTSRGAIHLGVVIGESRLEVWDFPRPPRLRRISV